MKKIIIIILAAAVLVGGGAVFFSLTGGNESDTDQAANTAPEQPEAFEALPTSGLSFAATFSGTAEGKQFQALMEYDGKEVIRYTTTDGDQKLVTVYTKDTYYMCQNDNSCIKMPLGANSQTGFNSDTYQYTEQELADFKSNSTYEGKKDCPAGTCDTWKTQKDGFETRIYIDTDTKRISQVESTNGTDSSKIVYEFKDITIELPANAQELPAPTM